MCEIQSSEIRVLSLIGCCWSRNFRAETITNRKISAVELRHQHVMLRVKSTQTPLARREFKAAALKKCFPQGTSLPVALQCFQSYFQQELSVLVLTVSLSWAFVIWYTLSSVTPLQIPTNMWKCKLFLEKSFDWHCPSFILPSGENFISECQTPWQENGEEWKGSLKFWIDLSII